MAKNISEEIRLRHLYRNLILLGKVTISRESAVRLIGPDSAYHLYARLPRSRRKRRR